MEELLLIHNSGCLISHASRKPKDDMDRDIFSGMFTAVQEFIKDSFKGKVDKGLKKMAFGEQKIQIEHGRNFFVIAIVEGSEPVFLPLYMLEVVKEVEEKYDLVLDGWNGDMSKVVGIDDIIKKLFQVTDEKGADVEGFELRFASVKDMDEHLIAMIGDNLGDYIRMADKVIKGILTMRGELGINVNIPIKNVAIRSQNEEVRDAVTKLKIPLLKEVNAKNLEVVTPGEDWRGLKLELNLNRDLMVPAFKQHASKVETLLKYQSPWNIKKSIENDGIYTLGLEGSYLDITPDMLTIVMSIPETVSFKDFDFGTIYIDKELTEELRIEGISNDIIEHINEMRKEIEIKDEDYIETKIVADDRTVERLGGSKEHIALKTHSYGVELPTENIFEDGDSGYKVTGLEGDGGKISIGIALIEWVEAKPKEGGELEEQALDKEEKEETKPEEEEPKTYREDDIIAGKKVELGEGIDQKKGEEEKTAVRVKLKRTRKKRIILRRKK